MLLLGSIVYIRLLVVEVAEAEGSGHPEIVEGVVFIFVEWFFGEGLRGTAVDEGTGSCLEEAKKIALACIEFRCTGGAALLADGVVEDDDDDEAFRRCF